MWYVLVDDGIYGEYDSLEEAKAICDRFNSRGEDAWIASDDYYDDDEDFDLGFDPYCGCYTYDC